MVLVARDLVNATMQTTDGVVGPHTFPHVLTGVKAASLRAAPPQAASALTPAPRALQNGAYAAQQAHALVVSAPRTKTFTPSQIGRAHV